MPEQRTIEITVHAVPVPQPRQRIAMRGKNPVAYTPTKHPVNAFKATCRQAWGQRYDGPPATCCDMFVRFIMPRPSSMVWKKRPMPRERYTKKKNDWDNLGKAVSDALNGLAYQDDGCLWRVLVERWYAAGNEAPHVDVILTGDFT